MNTSKQPVTPQPDEQSDELINPKPPSESPDESTVRLVVHTVNGDVIRTVGRVEREKELEEEVRQLYEKAHRLMEEADQWELRLRDRADWQMANAKIQASDDWRKRLEGHLHFNSADSYTDSISFKRKISDIERWQAGDGRLEFMGEALGKLLEALETIRGGNSKEACALKDELVAKFSPLLNVYKRAHSKPSYAHHKYLVRFLEVACGFHTEEGLPIGLEKNAADGINTLMANNYTLTVNNEWEGSMDKGMDLLELVCPFYSTSPTGQRMFAVIMGHLDILMKMDLTNFLSVPRATKHWRTLPLDKVKEEEKKWKDCYQKACNDILRRNKLPEHKFKREGGGRSSHWYDNHRE